MQRVGDLDCREGVAVHVAVVDQHTGSRHRQSGVSCRRIGVVHRHRRGVVRRHAAAITVEGDLASERQRSALHHATGVHRDGLRSDDRPFEDGERVKNRRGAYLPVNVFRPRAASQNDFYRAIHLEVGRYLEDPYIIGATRERDVRSRYQRRAREFVQTGDEVQSADIPGAGVQERSCRRGHSAGGVVVRNGQIALGRGQQRGIDHRACGPAGVDRIDYPVDLSLGNANGRPGDRTRPDIPINDASPRGGDRRPGQNREVGGRPQDDRQRTRREQRRETRGRDGPCVPIYIRRVEAVVVCPIRHQARQGKAQRPRRARPEIDRVAPRPVRCPPVGLAPVHIHARRLPPRRE